MAALAVGCEVEVSSLCAKHLKSDPRAYFGEKTFGDKFSGFGSIPMDGDDAG